jgi:flagellar motor switch protein FliN/FliY
MQVRDILNLEKGSLIEFDKLAGETVDLMVNDKKFAEGEVVVIDERFGIRITGLYKTADILKEVRK